MLRYRLLCVGRRARDPLLEAADDYLGRLGRYAKVEVLRCRESTPTKEAEALFRKLDANDRVVALDERGDQITTLELAARVERWQGLAHATVALLVGGAEGLTPAIMARADESVALSRFTLPHRLALVVLCEQLYRAHTILRGEPYHRG